MSMQGKLLVRFSELIEPLIFRQQVGTLYIVIIFFITFLANLTYELYLIHKKMDSDIDNVYGNKDTQVERIDWYLLRNTRVLTFK